MTGAPAQHAEELRELYRELILDHARSPRHFGDLPAATHSAQGINPLCGDKLHLHCTVDPEGNITEASFQGAGCAISMASASLLTEAVRGMSRAQALEFAAAVIGSVTGQAGPPALDIGKLEALQGVREFPSRVKCATLAWHALIAAMNNQEKLVSTE